MIYEKRGRWCVKIDGRLRKFDTKEEAQGHLDKYLDQDKSQDFLKVYLDEEDFDLAEEEEGPKT